MPDLPPLISSRLGEAFAYALEQHAGQRRKGTRIPYICHPLAVASLVLEAGGGEDEAIAGLLHDVPEDCGGRARLAEIRARFGEPVATLVDGCTDTYQDPKPPWRERKEAFLTRLQAGDPALLRVVSADKLHNARSMLGDYRREGEALWDRFSADLDRERCRAAILWYYGELVAVLGRAGPPQLTGELERVVAELAA